ncbi:MAG: Crp/Fnr family transcriptional regulator [Bacillota bacterium]
MAKNLDQFLLSLEPSEEDAFRENAMPLVFKKNHNIFANGDNPDYIYYIEKGRVTIYRLTKDGNTVTVAIRHPGELFGLAEAFMEKPRKCFAQAIETTSVLAVRTEDFKNILRIIPELSIKINMVLANRLRRAEGIIYDLINYNVSGRLARFLLGLQEQCGRICGTGVVLDIKLTHNDIAAIIGSTRQSVTQTLNEFKDEGCISIEDKKIVLLNKRKLQQKVY